MLEHNTFLVKERVKVFASHNTYDIFAGDSDSKEPIGVAEEDIGIFTKILRWFVSKQLLPTRIEIREKPDDSLVFSIRRGLYIFRSRVEVHDAQGAMVGYFKSKLISLSGGFYVYDKNDEQFAELKGNLWGFNYRVLTPDHSVELGHVSKKWGGVAKELFTSADTYAVEVSPDLKEQPIAKMLVLAAALATDMIFKAETKGTLDLDTGE